MRQLMIPHVMRHVFEQPTNCITSQSSVSEPRSGLTNSGEMEDMSRLVLLKQSLRLLRVP